MPISHFGFFIYVIMGQIIFGGFLTSHARVIIVILKQYNLKRKYNSNSNDGVKRLLTLLVRSINYELKHNLKII